MDLSIVIPVYNSEEILENLIEKIKININFVDTFELILVNDNSKDNSWQKIVELKKTNDFIVGINLMKNFSQHNAIMAGLNHTSGEVVIMMDDDLQHDPKYINVIFDKVKYNGFDVCYTNFKNKQHEKWKNLGSQFNDIMVNHLIKKPKELYLSPFKGISKQVKDLIIDYNGPYPYIDGLILSVTNKITSINIEHNVRFSGQGNYTLSKSITLWSKMATGFSISPLRFATYFGLLVSLFSFLLLILFVIQKFTYNAMPDGWTTIVVLILFFGGVQLFSIGIIGEYIGRTYLNINKKAQYIIREIV